MTRKRKKEMKYDGVWNLTGEEDLSPWSDQTQTWIRTKRGLFLISAYVGAMDLRFYATSVSMSGLTVHWSPWDGTYPEDMIVEAPSYFEEDEIAKAIEFIES